VKRSDEDLVDNEAAAVDWLSPAFLMNLGISNIEEMVAGSTAMVNFGGVARQVELNLKVDIRSQAQRVTRGLCL
jgi:hypothetical protein